LPFNAIYNVFAETDGGGRRRPNTVREWEIQKQVKRILESMEAQR
jgi:hypothetical protein